MSYTPPNEFPLNPPGETADTTIRISLAGAQAKLGVVLGEDGRIGLPEGSTPSSHIMKPPSPESLAAAS